MARYDLNEGIYSPRDVSEDELWSLFSKLFSTMSKNNTSYKFGLLKVFLDNLYNVDEQLTLTFNQLFSKFGEIYWNLILKYGLKQRIEEKGSRGSSIEIVIKDIVEKYSLPANVPYEMLTTDIMDELTLAIKRKCKRYVIGAMYEDFDGLIYSFSKKEEWICFNPEVYRFICRHKLVLEKLNYYEWSRFLEKTNEETAVTRISSKIDASSKRNNLLCYRKILFQEFENKCFYCGKKLTDTNTHVDHFIPWSFIKDDNLWNFVLACSECNLKKSDRLPDEKYLNHLVIRNRELMYDQITYKELMDNYQESTLRGVYYWAKLNGYDDNWLPNVKKKNSKKNK